MYSCRSCLCTVVSLRLMQILLRCHENRTTIEKLSDKSLFKIDLCLNRHIILFVILNEHSMRHTFLSLSLCSSVEQMAYNSVDGRV